MIGVVLLAATPAWAGPTTDATRPGDTAVTPQRTVMDLPAARAKDGDSDARTIDLMLQMQKPSAGLQFNERSRPAGSSDEIRTRAVVEKTLPGTQPQVAATPATTQTPAAHRPGAELPQNAGSGLFGSATTPQVTATRPTMPGLTPIPSDGGVPVRSRVPDGADLAHLLVWPTLMLDFLRDNRDAVIAGSAVALMLGWAASLFFSRRRG